MSESSYRGTCLCQGIVFDIHGQPEKVFACYCDDCRKNAGGPYQIGAKFNAEQVKIREKESVAQTGTWTVEKTLSGHKKQKVFCKQCGCTLWTIPMHHGGRIMVVRTALLDNGLEIFQPGAEFFAREKPAFVDSITGTKQFDTMPGY